MSDYDITESAIAQELLDANERIIELRAQLERVTAERDAARQSAAAWKRSTRMWRRIAANLTPWDIMSLWKSEPPFYDEGKSRKHRGVVND